MARKTKPALKHSEAKSDASDPHKDALKRYERAFQRERDNIDNAYEDLAFMAGVQWTQELIAKRELEDRPALTFNELLTFVRSVTGDIRQMRPGIKVVGVDNNADEETAEVLSGLMRYIENRSDATHTYSSAADSQVGAGIGHWRVGIEYADETTLNKELGIELIEDGISVLWDPDAAHPTRKDAMFCFVPVDMTRAKFEEMFPDDVEASIDPLNIKAAPMGWFSEDAVRVAEYWQKVPIKRTVALRPDGGLDDVTDDPEGLANAQAQGLQIENRPGYRVEMRYMSGISFLTPAEGDAVIKWPGRYIPVVPAIGEEIRIGRKRMRFGMVRNLKDPQRLINFMKTAEAEVVAFQPKAPWLVTEENVKDYEALWAVANTKALPYLMFRPDPKNGGQQPSRVAPPVSSQGLAEQVAAAEQSLRNISGVWNANLGAQSNETSGRAILARQTEGDNGTFVYKKNFGLAVGHTARILLDLIPHVYDTQRTIRIIGEDGQTDLVSINQPEGLEVEGAIEKIKNDVTVGAYDVHMEIGPAYATRQAEMRDGMQAFMQTAPNAAPLVMDLFAKAQDWPQADEIAKRLFHMLPPEIRAEEAKKRNDPSLMPPEPPPNPEAEAAAMKAQAEVEKMRLEVEGKRIDNVTREFEALKAQNDLAAQGPPMDVNALHALLSQMHEALSFIDQHAAMQMGPQESQEGHEGQMPPDMPPMPPPGAMPPPDGAMPPDMPPPDMGGAIQ